MIPPTSTSSPHQASAIPSPLDPKARTAATEPGCGVDSAVRPISDSSGLTADLTSPANQLVIALLTSQPKSSSPQPPSPGSEIASAAGVAGRAGAAVAAGTMSAARVARAGVTAAAGRAGAAAAAGRPAGAATATTA